MKKIKWNHVTWYSEALAVVVFIVVLMIGIYIGRQLERLDNLNAQINLSWIN